MASRQIGPLNTFEVAGSGKLVVLFHGYGANALDLYPLHQYIDAGENTGWLFPDGPVAIPIGPGMMGRAWFPIDTAALEEAMATGTHRDLSVVDPPGLAEAREMAMAMLAELDHDPARTYLGGFSQGSMLALDIALRNDVDYGGLVLLSGTLLNKAEWQALAEKRKPLRFFQSHGTVDPLLSYQAACDLEEMLTSSGFEGKLLSFEGGHEIPGQVVDELSAFLRADD